MAVAQNTYAVAWFFGKELNLVFGLQLSIARLVSHLNLGYTINTTWKRVIYLIKGLNSESNRNGTDLRCHQQYKDRPRMSRLSSFSCGRDLRILAYMCGHIGSIRLEANSRDTIGAGQSWRRDQTQRRAQIPHTTLASIRHLCYLLLRRLSVHFTRQGLFYL